MKTVSIIIPVYNAEKTIRKCIESIIKQSSENWEVIAIDDGSSDESYAILQEYAKSYPDKIYALTQKNAGVTKTRERGIQNAHGTYIMFVDNDDYIESNYVETFIREIESGDYDCVVGGYRRVNDEKKILFQYSPISKWMQYSIMTTWANIFKKEILFKYDIHFLDYAIGEDLYFNMKLFYNTDKIKRIHYIGYNWYFNSNSVNNTVHKGLRKTYDTLYLLNNLDEAIEHSRDEFYQLWYVKWIVWYLCFSGREATKSDFLKEADRMFTWLDENGIKCVFPMFSKIVEGEPWKNRFIIKVFLLLKKLHLLNLFATVYCRRSDKEIGKI